MAGVLRSRFTWRLQVKVGGCMGENIPSTKLLVFRDWLRVGLMGASRRAMDSHVSQLDECIVMKMPDFIPKRISLYSLNYIPPHQPPSTRLYNFLPQY